jgi:hypothetical protein
MWCGQGPWKLRQLRGVAGDRPSNSTSPDLPMIERDFLMRQIHQLVQVLAQVLARKRSDQPVEAQALLEEGLEESLGSPIERIRVLERNELRKLCAFQGEFSGDRAVAVADLLKEDGTTAGRERALWLYEDALAAGGILPHDILERIEALRAGQGA